MKKLLIIDLMGTLLNADCVVRKKKKKVQLHDMTHEDNLNYR